MKKEFIALSGCVIFCLLWIIYWPGLAGPFVFDDFHNIVDNPSLHIKSLSYDDVATAAFSTQTGPLARPIPMASFAVNYYFFGLHESSFKAFNVALHFMNAILIFLLSLRIAPRLVGVPGGSGSAFRISLLAASIWMLHPLAVTSVLYVVQRMVEMSTFFGLASVYFFIVGRESFSPWRSFSWHVLSFLMLVCAILSKENLIVLVPLIIWLDWLLYRWRPWVSGQLTYVRLLQIFYASGFLMVAAYVVMNFDVFVRGYQFRPFDMEERLMTQARVIWIYLRQILLPDIGSMHLFHDEVVFSRGMLSPATTLLSVLGLIFITAACYLIQRVTLLPLFALGWFLISHLVESTIISLEIMHTHRNYFPMIGITIAVAVATNSIYERHPRIGFLAIVLLLTLLSTGTYLRAQDWSSWGVLVVSEAEKNPTSARSQYEAGRYFYWQVEKRGNAFLQQDYDRAVKYFERGYRQGDTNLSNLAALLRLYDLVGKSPNPQYQNEALRRLKEERPDPNDINQFADLFRCRVDETCGIDSEFLARMVAAARDNHYLPLFTKSSIASGAAAVAAKQGQFELAIYYAVYAVDTSPDRIEFFKPAIGLARGLKNRPLLEDLMNNYSKHYKNHPEWAALKSEYEQAISEIEK